MQNLKVLGICGFVVLLFGVIGGATRLHEMKVSAGNPAAYAQVHVLDPLFAFPGSDTKDLSAQVAAFKVSAYVALPPFPEGVYVREHIYPFRFLDLLPHTEEARRQLLAEPTLEHATAYHTLLLSLIAAHIEDVTDAVTLLAHDTSSTEYQLFSGRTTASYTRNVLTDALRADKETEEKEKVRFACLQGTASMCESLTKLQLQFGPPDYIYRKKVSAPENIPSSVVANRTALQVMYPTLATSPSISLTQSSCFTDSPAYFAVVKGVSRLSNLPTTQAVYLSDLYFEDVRTSTQPFYAALRKEGDSFTYQPFRAYLCPDAGIDFGKSVTIQHLYDTLSQNPFTFKTPLSPVFKKVVDAKKNFIDAPVLADTTYTAFITAAAEAIRTTSAETLAQELGGQTELKRFMEMVTESQTNSVDFAGILGYFDDLQIGGSIIYDLQSSPTLVYFISRGGLSQLYALNNQTVSPAQEPLTSERTTHIDQTKKQGVPYVSYMQTQATEPAFSDIKGLLIQDIPARTKVLALPLFKLQQKRAVYVRTNAH